MGLLGVTSHAAVCLVSQRNPQREPVAEFPLDVVLQNQDAIRFEFFSVGGVFVGQLHRDEIVGEWRQVGSDPSPLTPKRTAGG